MPESQSEVMLIIIISTALILILGIIVVTGLLIQQKRKHRYQQQLLDMNNQYEKSLLESRLKIQEETSRAISENLHDNIGSNISTAMLLLYKDEQISEEEEDANRKEALTMLGVVVDDLKDISRSLNSDYLEEIGLNEAARYRLALLERSKKYEIELFINGNPKRLDKQKQQFLFYIFQEALTNISKHGRAKKISVKLDYDEHKMIMLIKDNGIGINSVRHEGLNKKGSGMINMKNHAAMMGAVLDIVSKDGEGTQIIVTLPDPYI